MKSTELELQIENCRDTLLEYLTGEIFHLRSYQDYEKIINSNCLQNSKDGNYKPSDSSERSFGVNRGYVCLFDLIDQSEENINKGLDCYNFTTPSWFRTASGTHDEYNLCYFILNKKLYPEIITNEEGKKICKETKEARQQNLWR